MQVNECKHFMVNIVGFLELCIDFLILVSSKLICKLWVILAESEQQINLPQKCDCLKR